MKRKGYAWEPFNLTYGPWYRLRRLGDDGVSVDLKSGGRNVEAVVQPDMDREGWYWSVKFAAYRPRIKKADDPKQKNILKAPLREHRVGGRAPDVDEAKEMAIAAFEAGRPLA